MGASDQGGADDDDAGAAPVRLTVPASTAHLRLARLVAAGVASMGDLDYDAIEDLRIAVDELCTLLVQVSPAGSSIEIDYRLDDGRVLVEAQVVGAVAVADATLPPVVPELTRQILGAVTEHFELWSRGGTAGFLLRSAAARATA
jgi:serine/threonine-protein kinase RsbW